MQTIHIFNPEHDMALAYNDEYFTAPHAGRMMRADLSFLPTFWANDGDIIIVDNVEQAREHVRHIKHTTADIKYLTLNQLNPSHYTLARFSVWGWDSAIRRQLIRRGFDPSLLPTANQLEQIRQCSHRKWAGDILKELRNEMEYTIGGSRAVEHIELLEQAISHGGSWVIKAPWSCSGRGIRYVENSLQPQIRAWAAKVIMQQGCVMLEHKYNKVKDFGLEFSIDKEGNVAYQGLSLFQSVAGAYSGNILATENDKLRMLSPYVSEKRLGEVISHLTKCLSARLRNIYEGPLGVDLMVVAAADGKSPFLIHPCVEVNLRRTMGHVALALAPTEFEPQQTMRITYDGHYHLRINNIQINNSTDK